MKSVKGLNPLTITWFPLACKNGRDIKKKLENLTAHIIGCGRRKLLLLTCFPLQSLSSSSIQLLKHYFTDIRTYILGFQHRLKISWNIQLVNWMTTRFQPLGDSHCWIINKTAYISHSDKFLLSIYSFILLLLFFQRIRSDIEFGTRSDARVTEIEKSFFF